MAQLPMVLIIDDSVTSRLLMANALQQAGYDVITASDGPEGRMKAVRQRPRCIILDVVLPGVDGFKLCRQLRALDPYHKLSIIMVSVKNTALDHSWGLRQGADRYLPKPFSAEDLIRMVGEVIAEHS